MGSAFKSSSATGTAMPSQHLGDLRTSMHHARGCTCLETVSTAAVISSTIPDPGPWLAPLISSTKEAHALDHGKDHGNPWVRVPSC